MPVAPGPPSSDNLVGQAGGPPTPPALPGSRIDILAEPRDPGPGASTVLTISVSASRGTDRYAVTDTQLDLSLVEKPDGQATLSATSVKTDVTGSATVRLTTSPVRGRHVVRAAAGSVANQLLIDTLAGAASGGRARHGSNVGVPPLHPAVNPLYLVGAAIAILMVSFLLPYRRRLLGLLRRSPKPAAQPAPRRVEPSGPRSPDRTL
ncbi:MAG: hypothetical protein ABR598_04680 [Candidatus Dormibacteria bacterium]